VSTTTRTIWSAPVLPIRDLRLRLAVAVLSGLAVGCATSFGQRYLDGALNALVNSASAWLVAPFFCGALMRTARGAAATGLTVCTLQLVGYYVTAEARGYPAGGAIVLFWLGCALVAGPLFGLAGQRRRVRRDDIGATLLPAAFLAEGLWVYALELRYWTTAALWLVIGAALACTLARAGARWLMLTLPAALAGEMVLSLVYRQAF
jgi:hypothetical protein